MRLKAGSTQLRMESFTTEVTMVLRDQIKVDGVIYG